MSLSLKVQPAQLVSCHDHKVTTTSLIIAEAFKKDHRNITQAVRNLECSEEFRSANFSAYPYQHPQNKQTYTAYEITKDGFMFLVMGFTGAKAAAWKEAFINAFNQMQSELASQPQPHSWPDDWQRQLNAEKIRIAFKALSLGTGTYRQTLMGWMQQHFGSRTASEIKAPAEAVLYKLSDLVYRERIGHLEQVNSMRKEDGKPTFVITPPPYSGMSFTYNAQSALLQKEYPVYLEMMKEIMHPNHSTKANQQNQPIELKPATPEQTPPKHTPPKHTPPKHTPPKQTHLDGRMVSYIENGTVTHSRHLSHDEMIVSSTNLVTLVKQASLTQDQHLELISHCSAQLQNGGASSC